MLDNSQEEEDNRLPDVFVDRETGAKRLREADGVAVVQRTTQRSYGAFGEASTITARVPAAGPLAAAAVETLAAAVGLSAKLRVSPRALFYVP